MARKRDYAAEYRARKAREAARGFTSPSQAQRARQKGAAAPVRVSQRQVYRKADQGTVTTTVNGGGLGVVARTLGTLPAPTPITVYATMRVYGGGVRMFTTEGTAEQLHVPADTLRAAVADMVTDQVTDSGGHKKPGAPVLAFTEDDVVSFQVAW